MAIIQFGQKIPINKYLSDIDKYSEIEFGNSLFETKLDNLEPLSNKKQKVKKSYKNLCRYMSYICSRI